MIKKVKYNRTARAYVIPDPTNTKRGHAIWEITLDHGDLAIPHGYVERSRHSSQIYHTYMFAHGHSADRSHARLVGTSMSMHEAIMDVRKAWETSPPYPNLR